MIEAFAQLVRSTCEEIGVGACADEDQFAGLELVNEEPVRFHVAVPVAVPFTAQGMDSAPRWKGAVALEEVHDDLQFAEVFALTSHTAKIPFKGRRREQRTGHLWSSRNSRKDP